MMPIYPLHLYHDYRLFFTLWGDGYIFSNKISCYCKRKHFNGFEYQRLVQLGKPLYRLIYKRISLNLQLRSCFGEVYTNYKSSSETVVSVGVSTLFYCWGLSHSEYF